MSERDPGPLDADGCAHALAAEDGPVAVGALTALAWIGAPRQVAAVLALAGDERFVHLREDLVYRKPTFLAAREAS